MDYVEGTDAARLLRERHPERDAARRGRRDRHRRRRRAGLRARARLLHRDVKPANILLAHPESGDQRILLADFGIARWADDISGLTATNMTVGTVSYAAPEQLMGERLDGRADQYALAATAFHLLTGSPPFQHSNPAVVISQHLSAAPPAIGERTARAAGAGPGVGQGDGEGPEGPLRTVRRLRPRPRPPARVPRRLRRGATRLSRRGARRSQAAARDHAAAARRHRACDPGGAAGGGNRRGGHGVSSRRRPPEPTPTAKPPTSSRLRRVTPLAAARPRRHRTPSTDDSSRPRRRRHPGGAAPAAVIGANCSPVGSTGTTAGRVDRVLLDTADHRRDDLVADPGRHPEPHGDAPKRPTEQPLPTEESRRCGCACSRPGRPGANAGRHPAQQRLPPLP